MTVTNFTFPQNGDNDFAENFGAWLGRSNITDYVEEGMSVSITDPAAPEVEVTEGKAFISQDQKTISSNNETRLTLDYCIITPTQTLDSTNNGLLDGEVNYLFLEGNVGTNDSPDFQAYSDTANAPANTLHIATIDLVNDTVTEVGRSIDITAEEGIFSVNLGVPVYSDTSNAESGQGNVIFIDGSGSQDAGLYAYNGSSYNKVGVDKISDISDVTGITGLEENTATNRPTAGTEGRIFFNTTDNTVEYDTGSTWDVIGIDPAEIDPSELGFDPATQSELDSHIGIGDAHHPKTSTIDELSDVDLTDIEVNTSGNRPAAGTNGRLFIERDTNRIYYDDGSTWRLIGLQSHDDLVNVSADDHHTYPVPNTGLVNDSITVNANDGLSSGGSVSLGSSVGLSVSVSDFAGTHLSDDGTNNLQVDDNFLFNTGDTMTGTLNMHSVLDANNSSGGRVVLPVGTDKYAT